MRKLDQEVDSIVAKASSALDAHGELALHAFMKKQDRWCIEIKR